MVHPGFESGDDILADWGISFPFGQQETLNVIVDTAVLWLHSWALEAPCMCRSFTILTRKLSLSSPDRSFLKIPHRSRIVFITASCQSTDTCELRVALWSRPRAGHGGAGAVEQGVKREGGPARRIAAHTFRRPVALYATLRRELQKRGISWASCVATWRPTPRSSSEILEHPGF